MDWGTETDTGYSLLSQSDDDMFVPF